MAHMKTLAEVDQWRDLMAVTEAASAKDWAGVAAVWRNTARPGWLVATLAASLAEAYGDDAPRMLANVRAGLERDQAELTGAGS